MPEQLIFTPAEIDRLSTEVLAVEIPRDVRRRIEFFASQFEFLDTAALTLEYKTKDTARLAVDSAGEPGTGTGLGVVSMRERAESMGGSCQAGPGGRGWLVEATLPLAAAGGRRREGAR